MALPPSAKLKNLTIRLPPDQIKHIKKRAKAEKHYTLSEVVRRMVAADMAGQSN